MYTHYLHHFFLIFKTIFHCVKIVQIRSYFWSVFSCIQSEYRKIRIRNNSVFGNFLRRVLYINVTDTTGSGPYFWVLSRIPWLNFFVNSWSLQNFLDLNCSLEKCFRFGYISSIGSFHSISDKHTSLN